LSFLFFNRLKKSPSSAKFPNHANFYLFFKTIRSIVNQIMSIIIYTKYRQKRRKRKLLIRNKKIIWSLKLTF